MARKKIHILGICGTFMGSIALLARELGFQVTGSDENIYPPMSDHLFEQGIEIMDMQNYMKIIGLRNGSRTRRATPSVPGLLIKPCVC